MFQNSASILESNLYGILSKTIKPLPVGLKWNMGTGFAVNDTDILTVAHNLYVDKNPNIIHAQVEVILNSQIGSKMQNASIVFIDHQNDLAVLRVGQTSGGVTFRNAISIIGESCGFMGYPFASHNKGTAIFNALFKSGVITRTEPNHIFIDRTLFPGSSGGPISDTNGLILGIVNQYMTAKNTNLPAEISFGKDANLISQILSSNGVSFKTV